jgi:two-component system NtrC family sensor kinase
MTITTINQSTSIANATQARLLVVDDEPDIADSVREFLAHRTGSLVDVAHSGEEAVEMLGAALSSSDGPYDLVVLDMRMPEMSGRDVLDYIRQHPDLLYTRVIILTATAVTRERVAALSAGADDYITKPYQPPELLARVKTMLRSHQLEKQLQQQSQQLSALNEVSTSMTTSLHPKTVLDIAARGIRHVLNSELAAIFSYDHPTRRLVCREVVTRHNTQPNYNPVEVGRGVIGKSFSRRTSYCLNYPTSHSEFEQGVDAPSHVHLHNIMASPLIVRGKPFGVLVAANKLNGDFTDVDRGLFASLTNSVGRSIENSWLFLDVQNRQRELLESRNRLQAVIDGIQHPIYTVNEKYELIAVNKTKADELEKTSEELVGNTCYKIFFGRDKPCERCSVARTFQYGESFRWAIRWLGDDKLPREWDIIAYPIPGDGINQAVVVWEDITEEKRLEYSLMQAAKLAAIGQLAAGVAHEINNPMSVINASAAMLLLDIDEDDDRRELVELIERAGDRAARVVRDLLDVARQEAYEVEELNLVESIKQALNLLAYQLQSAQVKVVEDYDPDLPTIYGSAEHLKTVWINLIINARDAVQSRPEGREIELMTRLSPEKDYVRVLIRDNGVGMSDSEKDHIFEPFYTTKDPGKGTGLGLSTSHRIIEQHAGKIEVASSVGEGATFVVHLPVSTR